MIVAITGCIGSGKSYILKQINSLHNIDVFSADEFTLQAYENEIVKRKLDKVFNCLKDGKVDKKIIGLSDKQEILDISKNAAINGNCLSYTKDTKESVFEYDREVLEAFYNYFKGNYELSS